MPPKKGPISKGNFIFQPFLRASCYFSEDVFSKEVTGTTTFSKSLRLRIHDARDREDLIDQHVAYFLRKNPEAIRCKVCHLGSRSLDFLLDALNKQEIQSLKLFFFLRTSPQPQTSVQYETTVALCYIPKTFQHFHVGECQFNSL